RHAATRDAARYRALRSCDGGAATAGITGRDSSAIHTLCGLIAVSIQGDGMIAVLFLTDVGPLHWLSTEWAARSARSDDGKEIHAQSRRLHPCEDPSESRIGISPRKHLALALDQLQRRRTQQHKIVRLIVADLHSQHLKLGLRMGRKIHGCRWRCHPL